MHILLEKEIEKEYIASKLFSVELKKFRGISHLIRKGEDLSDYDLFHQSCNYLTQNILNNCKDDILNSHIKRVVEKNIPIWSNTLHERVHRGEKGLVVTFKGKHGEYIYDISTPELFRNTFISELNQNYKLNYYQDLVNEKSVTEEEINQLNLFRKEIKTDKTRVEDILSKLNNDNPCIPIIAKQAYSFLESRIKEDCQDEVFDIFTLMKMKSDIKFVKNTKNSYSM